MQHPFDEFALLLIITTLLGVVAVRLRQPVSIAYIVVDILPDRASNLALLNALAEHHYDGQIAIVACGDADAASLHSLGRVEIILPFHQAADFAALDLAARIAAHELKPDKEATS